MRFYIELKGGKNRVCVWLLVDFHVTSYSTQNFSHAMDFLEGREHGKEIHPIFIRLYRRRRKILGSL